jgi:putative spermidine/putrescine transport system permease protein
MSIIATTEPATIEALALSAPRRRAKFGRLVAWAWLAIVVLLIYAPILVIMGASVDPGEFVMFRAFLQFPPQGFTLHWYFNISPSLWVSVANSFLLAGLVAVASVVIGVPAALGLVRGNFPGRNLVATLFRSPLQIPHIVVGVAFLQSSYMIGAATGVHIHASVASLLIAHIFVAVPYVIGATGSVLAQVSPSLEEAALSLGASRWRAFRRVTLPLLLPGIFGGALFAFLVSFTDVTIALFLAPSNFVTFPIRVYSSIQTDLESSLPAVASLVFLISAAAIFVVQRILGMESVLRSGGAKG